MILVLSEGRDSSLEASSEWRLAVRVVLFAIPNSLFANCRSYVEYMYAVGAANSAAQVSMRL